jgi:protein O-GlcNAc transferase
MQMTSDQAIRYGLRQQNAGRLAEAESIYRQVLDDHPEHPDALHLLGMVACQSDRVEAAIPLLEQAVSLRPATFQFHYGLANALLNRGRLDEAIASYQRTIQLNPIFGAAYLRLGDALWRRASFDEAIAACSHGLEMVPHAADGYLTLGNALHGSARTKEAIAALIRATELDANHAEAHFNLAALLRLNGDLEAAIRVNQRAIQLNPGMPESHLMLGEMLHETGLLADAITALKESLRLKPGNANVLNRLGGALRDNGELDAAITTCRALIALRPDFAEAYVNLGIALSDKFQPTEAIEAHRQAIALNPDLPEAHNNLGIALKEIGQLGEAIAATRQAIALRPGYVRAHDNLVYAAHFHASYDAAAIAEELRRWNRQHADPLRKFFQPHSNDRKPDRRLRVGYVSPNFFAQAEAHFVLPLLGAHDHRQFEVHLYSSVRKPDAVTELHRRCADHWHDVLRLTDGQLAEQVRRDRIDILVDPVMHMADSRLLSFARKPAPVQITWLAYPGGTGLEAMDYRLTDRFLDPPESDCSHYVEKSIRLPDWWACYCETDSAAPPAAARARDRNTPICFGSLNNPCKINAPTIRLWAHVLDRVPQSRLLLLADAAGHQEHLRRQFDEAGIDGNRLDFVGHSPREDYLRIYDRIDIALDPLPYNGITTTLDALWMGVPVVTLAGRTAAGRAGLGILTLVGLADLATRSENEFVATAIALANDRARQRSLRSALRGMLKRSPLMDAPRFARNLEAVYRGVWRVWCIGQNEAESALTSV